MTVSLPPSYRIMNQCTCIASVLWHCHSNVHIWFDTSFGNLWNLCPHHGGEPFATGHVFSITCHFVCPFNLFENYRVQYVFEPFATAAHQKSSNLNTCLKSFRSTPRETNPKVVGMNIAHKDCNKHDTNCHSRVKEFQVKSCDLGCGETDEASCRLCGITFCTDCQRSGKRYLFDCACASRLM